jgi:hypothetical protein
MSSKLIALSLFLTFGARCPRADAGEARPPYKFLRYDEDYRFLADPSQRTDLWDSVKYIPLDGAGFLSLGGEARERFETYKNEFFKTNTNASNAYFLQRYLFQADYHPTGWLRVFTQLQSSLEGGRPGGPRRTDRDAIDMHQLFADLVEKISDDAQLTLRIGRQEMSYGAERLIAAREGPNNRRAFDEVRLLFKQKAIAVDAFFGSPVEIDPGQFDDQNIRDVWFWGGYGTMPLHAFPGFQVEFYYLGLSNPHAGFNQGMGREERHTLSGRLFGTLDRWDFNDEVIYQFGQFGSGDINAWSVATDEGYTLKDLWGQPRFGLRAAAASGDDNLSDPNLQTFNPLFVRGNYFSEAGLLSPQNFIDLYPTFRLKPIPSLIVDLGFDFHWRESLSDGIYQPGGLVIFPGNPDFAYFVGTELVLGTAWQISPHLTLSAAYSHFFAGQFIRQSQGDDADFGALWATFKF